VSVAAGRRFDAAALARELDARGFAVVPALLGAADCATLARSYDDPAPFRKTVVMERHGYGRGAYRYFAYPLPPLVAALRAELYAALAPLANDWSERLRSDVRYPPALAQLLERCAAGGQSRPTPLVLRYAAGDYNALHQDRYGPLTFPFQATVLLSDPDDFGGGEFVLVEGKPRRQSVAHVVPLARGDAVVFPNAFKPNPRGGRSTFRHGVAAVRSGTRVTLGVILHDAP
jgi:hypothetical protein